MEAPIQPVGPVRRPNAGRALGLADLIVIVALAAVWFLIIRDYGRTEKLGPGWYLDLGSFRKLRLNRHGLALLGYGLEIASVALLILRWRHPRPRWRRLWRQPGWLASVGATVGSLIGLTGALATSLAATSGFNPSLWPSLLTCLDWSRGSAAPGVLGAWLGLGLTRRWRAERSAIDRLGRLVGWLWLVEFVLVEVLQAKWFSVIDNIWGWR